jgi:hypothetical protein
MARRRQDESGFDALLGVAQASPRAGAVVAFLLAVAAAVLHFTKFGPWPGANDLLAGLAAVVAVVVAVMAAVEAVRRRIWPAARRAGPVWVSGEPTPYRRIERLVTSPELAFYQELLAAAGPGAVVLVKVRLADLLELPYGTERRRHWLSKVTQKHVDFVVCHRDTLRPFLLVELDDPTHDRPDRVARDGFVDEVMAAAGWPLEHVRTAAAYDRAALAAMVRRHAGAVDGHGGRRAIRR